MHAPNRVIKLSRVVMLSAGLVLMSSLSIFAVDAYLEPISRVPRSIRERAKWEDARKQYFREQNMNPIFGENSDYAKKF